MALKYSQVPADLYRHIQSNSGILCKEFDIETFVASGIIAATTGGVTNTINTTYRDEGEGIDNMPPNTMELRKVDSREISFSATLVSTSAEAIKMAIGTADIETLDNGVKHIKLRPDIKTSDYISVWWVGDYSDVNTGEKAGFIAIHYYNSFSDAGFSLKTNDKGKGTFPVTFKGHYSIENIDKDPVDVYVFEGGEQISALAVTSEPGEESGTTTITVTPKKSMGNQYYYKINAVTAPNVQPGDDVSNWDEWDGTSDITATDGYKITIVEADSDGKAVKSGNTIIRSAD